MYTAGKMRESNKSKESNKFVCTHQVLSKRKGIQKEKILKTKNLIYRKDNNDNEIEGINKIGKYFNTKHESSKA
jgi:hypothetical protein